MKQEAVCYVVFYHRKSTEYVHRRYNSLVVVEICFTLHSKIIKV